MSDEPLSFLCQNDQRVILVPREDGQLTLRIQTLTGHNRAVAKLGPAPAVMLAQAIITHTEGN